MASSEPKSSPLAGFLTVCESESAGLFGGYLVLNLAGRPLEFHCTSPVKASRVQEILYGGTLRPYLYGEQIGQALLEKSKVLPSIVFTDVAPAMAVRAYTRVPVVFVDGRATAGEEGAPPGETARAGPAERLAPNGVPLQRFCLGTQPLAVAATHPGDAETVRQQWQQYVAEFDLQEPFGRIREAIEEARRGAR